MKIMQSSRHVHWCVRTLCYVLIFLSKITHSYLPTEINIGGLFEYDYRAHQIAFQYAIDSVNRRTDILPGTILISDIQNVPKHDSYHTSKKACHQLQNKVAAIFGPMSELSSAHVQSMCDSKEIPHIETRLNMREIQDVYSINLHPHPDSFGKALLDLIKSYGWGSFTVLYEDQVGLLRLQSFITSPEISESDMKIKRMFPKDGDYSSVFKVLKRDNVRRMIVDCEVTQIPSILHQIDRLNMLSEYYHIVFTNLDLEMVNMEPYRYGGANITAFRLVNPENARVIEVLTDWLYMNQSPLEPASTTIMAELALMYDGVMLFAQALHDLSQAQLVETESLSCFERGVWSKGISLLNYMQTTRIDGLSGHIQFDPRGYRTHFDLDIIELTVNGLEQTGIWNPDRGVNFTRGYEKVVSTRIKDTLSNRTLRVTTVLEKPFTMIKERGKNGKLLTGNDAYEGFCIDMLYELSKVLNFTYQIQIVKDSQYGVPTGGDNWNGMVGELLRQEADIAVAPLTISLIREQVIDFTKPYMTTGISILFKRPKRETPGLFSFLSPLSTIIWMYVLVAYVGVSFLIFLLARFSPYEWYNPHPCNPDSDIVENQFSLLNSLWFTVGSLMQQGSDFAPRATSTRLVSGSWWFFTLILISSYTANLAAFLTVQRMKAPIENADDLSKQTEIKYGTRSGGSSRSFFEQSKIPVYEKMWNFMSTAEPSVFVNTSEEGIQRVLDDNYAYLMESLYRDYAIHQDCDLMGIGGLLDNKGYGIGVPRASPYRDALSDAILKLQEEQTIQILMNKWWRNKDGIECDKIDDQQNGGSERLGLANVGGVFVVLLAGLALSVIVSFVEFIVNARRNADQDKQSLCSEMAEELRFAVRCRGSSKRPAKKGRRAQSIAENGLTLLPLNSSSGLNHRNTILLRGKESIA